MYKNQLSFKQRVLTWFHTYGSKPKIMTHGSDTVRVHTYDTNLVGGSFILHLDNLHRAIEKMGKLPFGVPAVAKDTLGEYYEISPYQIPLIVEGLENYVIEKMSYIKLQRSLAIVGALNEPIVPAVTGVDNDNP